MRANLLQSAASVLRPFRLAGPIFTKELRVASRRKRNYVLRFVYLSLLTLFVAITWINVVEGRSFGGVGVTYRMSMAGRSIVATVCWFQFIAVQLTAIVLLSTAISEEVYHRTIGALLTTPITSLQIVVGKLGGKTLLLLELMAVSLPLLALVRVFGGVPWGYLLAATCITFTAGLFAGSLALLCSIHFHRAHTAVLIAIGGLFLLYAAIPALLGLAAAMLAMGGGLSFLIAAGHVVAYCNPFAAMIANEASASGVGRFFSLWWPLHCLIMLGASALLVAISAKRVRRAAIRAATGGASGKADLPAWIFAPSGAKALAPVQPLPLPADAAGKSGQLQFPAAGNCNCPDFPLPSLPLAAEAPPGPVLAASPPRPERPIRPVADNPLLWKELHSRRRGGRTLQIVGICITSAALGWAYLSLGYLGALDEAGVHGVFAVLYTLAPLLHICVHAATRISSERESRTLPILLTTPLSEWQIVRAKAVAVFRQVLPAWAPLGLHLLAFTMATILAPVVLLHGLVLAGWTTLFLTSSGLYFSARFKKTTTAVVMNLGLGLTLWFLVPTVLSIGGGGGSSRSAGEAALMANPVVEAAVVVPGAVHANRYDSSSPYRWPDARGGTTVVETTLVMMIVPLVYAAVSLLFLRGASRRLRKNIF